MKNYNEIIKPIIEFNIFLEMLNDQHENAEIEELFCEYKFKLSMLDSYSWIADIENFLSNKKDPKYFVKEIIRQIEKIGDKFRYLNVPAYLFEAINRNFISVFRAFDNTTNYLQKNYLNKKDQTKELNSFNLENYLYKNKIDSVKQVAKKELGSLDDTWEVPKSLKKTNGYYVAFFKVLESRGFIKKAKKLTTIIRDKIISETFNFDCTDFKNNHQSKYKDLEDYFHRIFKNDNDLLNNLLKTHSKN